MDGRAENHFSDSESCVRERGGGEGGKEDYQKSYFARNIMINNKFGTKFKYVICKMYEIKLYI